MLTFLTENPLPQEFEDYREVALDEPLTWLMPDDVGFKAYGVSAGVVFVVYENQNLVACQHWGMIPGSKAKSDMVAAFVDGQFGYLSETLRKRNADLSQFTIYAVGAQESSQNLIDELRNRDTDDQEFILNTDNLHLVQHEDTFDFYVNPTLPHFIAQHHREIFTPIATPTMLVQYTNDTLAAIQTVVALATIDSNQQHDRRQKNGFI